MENISFIQTYFIEEKIESLFFIIIGSIAISLAIIFLGLIKYSFFKGIAYPLLLVGMIQIIVGYGVCNRVPKDIERVEQMISKQTYLIGSNEIPRMKTVLKNFTIYKWIEMTLIVTSVILIISFYKSPLTFWKGFGLGLLIQASLMLFMDVLAQHRADIYLQNLMNI